MVLLACGVNAAADPSIRSARDRQDTAALEAAAARLAQQAEKAPSAASHYRLAGAHFYLAEVWLELTERAKARSAAEAGLAHAERAIALEPAVAEHHRLRGALCGLIIPANVLAGLKYGRCAQESIQRAIELDPRSALAYLTRGVGQYYLPPAFGGGTEQAIADFRKAIELNPKLAEAHVWLGIAYRKAGQPGQAREAFQRSLQMNPHRLWARQQLEKTPKE